MATPFLVVLLFIVNPGASVLAVGLGLWAVWQFDRERGILYRATLEKAKRPQTWIWWYTWILVAMLSGSWLVFVLFAIDRLGSRGITPANSFLATGLLAAGIMIWAVWQLIRRGLAAKTKRAVSGIDPHQTSPAREFDLT